MVWISKCYRSYNGLIVICVIIRSDMLQKETQSEPAFMNRVKEKQRLLKIMGVSNADEKRRYFSRIKELNKLMLSQIHTELQKKQREINTIRDKLAYNEVVRFRGISHLPISYEDAKGLFIDHLLLSVK